MKVELTKEQVEFIRDLCCGVEYDYENYSPDEQKKREWLAYDILDSLDNAEETES